MRLINRSSPSKNHITGEPWGCVMMICLRSRRIAGAMALAAAVGVCAAAETVPSQQPEGQKTAPPAKPVVKAARTVPIVSLDGKDNYDTYCAVCHGRDATGNGPAAPAMKVPVPDLTRIAARNQGKFDFLSVENIIRQPGKTRTRSHGVDEMPIWGEVFSSEDRGQSTLRIKNIVTYLQSIQAPARPSRP